MSGARLFHASPDRTRLILLGLIALLVYGVSLDSKAQAAPKFVGQRLIDLVPTDPGVSPDPGALKTALVECKLDRIPDDIITYAKSCVLQRPGPRAKRKTEPDVAVIAITPRCCLGSVLIRQTRLDQEGGLYLFDGLPGVKLKPLQCPNLDHLKFSVVEQNGQPKFVISEFRSAGTAGTSVETTIYFGTTTARCDFFDEQQKLLMQAEKKPLR